MQNFIYSIPTKVLFGKGQVQNLGTLAAEFGTHALLVYGGGSIKRTGVYDSVTQSFAAAGVSRLELGGVEPNPKIGRIREGVELCRQNEIDCVIAIGGGSSIDCAKTVAAGACYPGDAWDLVKDPKRIVKALPVLTVLTIAATGSEMDYFAVVSNPETNEKISIDAPALFPKYTIMDPTFTETVPQRQTAAGTADILSHIFEVYFQRCGNTDLQDGIMESLMRTVIKNGRTVMQYPDDYDARANLMWASSWAINGFIACGKAGPWVCHPMEHQLSAFYDIVHGEGLAVLIPHWMRYTLNEKTADLYAGYGARVFGLKNHAGTYALAAAAIDRTQAFFRELRLPETLRECGVPKDADLETMAERAAETLGNAYVPLDKSDVLTIYREAL